MKAMIRTIFGDIEKNERLRMMFDTAMEREKRFSDDIKSSHPIYYFVLGEKNADFLHRNGIKDIILVDKESDVRPNKLLPIFYNKTYLAGRAFDIFGGKVEFTLIDMDTTINKWPNDRMWELFSLKETVAGFQSPVRINYRHLARVPLLSNDGRDDIVYNFLICSCVIYCNDKKMWDEYLATYQILYDRLIKKPYIFRRSRSLIDYYHDEHVLTYWFDSKYGAIDIGDIVDMVEPHSIFVFNKNHRHEKTIALKDGRDNYFRHNG